MPRYEQLDGNKVRIIFDSFAEGISETNYTGRDGQFLACRDLDPFFQKGVLRADRQLSWTNISKNGYACYATDQSNLNNFVMFGDDAGATSPKSKIWYNNGGSDMFTGALTAGAVAVSSSVSANGTGYPYIPSRPTQFAGNLYWFSWISANNNFSLAKLDVTNLAAGLDQFISSNAGSYYGAGSGGTPFNSSANTGRLPVGPITYKDNFYYADGNKLFRNDGTAGGEVTTLTLQSNLYITSISVVNLDGNDWLALGINYKYGSNNSLVYIYDGVSTFLRQIIDVGTIGLQVVRQVENSLVAICSNNPFNTNIADTTDNILRFMVWNGGGKMKEAYLQLLSNSGGKTTPLYISDASATVINDTLLFGIDPSSATSLDTGGIWGFRLPNILFQKYSINVGGSLTDALDIKNISYVNGYTYTFFKNNTQATKNFASDESASYSANALIRTLPFRFDTRHPGVIKLIEGQVKSMPASTTITIAHYPNQGGSGQTSKTTGTTATTIGTISTTGAKTFKFTTENGSQFPLTDLDQIEIQVPGINTTSRPELIMPFIIEAEIRKTN